MLILDLEWKVLYVDKAEDVSSDIVLDEILVGPVPVGVNKFVLQAGAPDPNKLSQDDLLGVTVVLVTCSYREKEFVRVGYYVNNEYTGPVDDPERGPPRPYDLSQVTRQILADKPRVTKFPIPWGNVQEENESSNSTNNRVSVSPSSQTTNGEAMEKETLPATVSSE